MRGASGASATGAEILQFNIGQTVKRELGDTTLTIGDRAGHPIIDHTPKAAKQFACAGIQSFLQICACRVERSNGRHLGQDRNGNDHRHRRHQVDFLHEQLPEIKNGRAPRLVEVLIQRGPCVLSRNDISLDKRDAVACA
jgi:hypothetical protein